MSSLKRKAKSKFTVSRPAGAAETALVWAVSARTAINAAEARAANILCRCSVGVVGRVRLDHRRCLDEGEVPSSGWVKGVKGEKGRRE